MNSSQPPSYVIPSVDNPQRTLGIVKWLVLVFVLALLAAGGWRLINNRAEADSLKKRNIASLSRSVITVRPKPGETNRKIVLPASLRGSTETLLYARSNGYLSAWTKTIGDPVKKGELLAVIDTPELEQELAQARAVLAQIKVRLSLGRTTLKRWEQLKEADSVVQQELDEKRSAVLQAEADLATAQINVKRIENIASYRRIVAPFSGVITRRNVDVGDLISAGNQELFALTQIDPLRLTVWVPQAYADTVAVGQEVSVRPADALGKAVSARVEHVAGALDPINRSRQVDINLPNKDGKWLPGSYVEIAINVVGKSNPLVVPANVLVIDQAGTHVVTVDAGHHIRFQNVSLGRDFGREVEIIDGVKADDVLVASPSDLLVAGEVVGVVESAKPKAKGAAKS